MNSIKYSQFLKETQANYYYISYNALNRTASKRIRYTFADALTILKPYFKIRISEQFKVVMPIALYLASFQFLVLGQFIENSLQIALGLLAVVMGLMFFMEGLKVGLMPFGEIIGYYLPQKVNKSILLGIALALGVGATFAEPAIGVLKEAGKIVVFEKAPLLYAMLNHYAHYTVIAVSIGVGIATLLGIMMFVYGWSLKPLIFVSLMPTLALTVYAFTDNDLASVIGLAWDCGAVTTGPVTVPLVLSLGVGVAGVIKHSHSKNLPGFGLVTLASMFPITAVIITAMLINASVDVHALKPLHSITTTESLLKHPFLESIILALRAIVPLVLFLYFVQAKIIKEPIKNLAHILYGIILCVVGMSVFNIGLNYGLSALGSQVGSLTPATYSFVSAIPHSPLFHELLGLTLCVVFAFFLGYTATLAEPALNALGLTVENITNGAFRKNLVMITVSLGVGFGIMLGVLKIIFDIPIAYLLVPLYLTSAVLTILAEEKYVNLGWDSAGVTTGPITVPLVIALGLGFANASNALDGFGILAMASVCPIIAVLMVGLYVSKKQKETSMQEG